MPTRLVYRIGKNVNINRYEVVSHSVPTGLSLSLGLQSNLNDPPEALLLIFALNYSRTLHLLMRFVSNVRVMCFGTSDYTRYMTCDKWCNETLEDLYMITKEMFTIVF